MSGSFVLFMLALVGVWSLCRAVDRMSAALTEARREHIEAGERPALGPCDEVDERQRRRELWEWNHPGGLTRAHARALSAFSRRTEGAARARLPAPSSDFFSTYREP